MPKPLQSPLVVDWTIGTDFGLRPRASIITRDNITITMPHQPLCKYSSNVLVVIRASRHYAHSCVLSFKFCPQKLHVSDRNVNLHRLHSNLGVTHVPLWTVEEKCRTDFESWWTSTNVEVSHQGSSSAIGLFPGGAPFYIFHLKELSKPENELKVIMF